MAQVTFETREPIHGREPALGADSRHAALAEEGRAPAAGAAPAVARLTISLGAGETLQVFDDRVLAGRYEYPYDDWFGARLVPDPRAPLTVRPALAVALVTHGAYWGTFVPPDERDAARVLAAIRDACRRRGIEPIGIDDPVQLPELPQPPQQAPSLLVQGQAPDHLSFGNRESLLLALIHRLATAFAAFRKPRAG